MTNAIGTWAGSWRARASWALALALTVGATARAQLVIDRVDAEGFANEKSPNYKKIIFYADIFDDQNRFLTGLEKSGDGTVKVFIDDKEVQGKVTVQTFKDANQALAVAVLVAAHNSYANYDPESGMPNILELEKNGFESFLKSLSNQNYVAVWYYNEDGLSRVYSWSNRPDEAGATLQSLVKPPTDKASGKAPSLYANIQKVMESIKEFETTLPPRRILLLMSDGKDAIADKAAAVEKRINGISEIAKDTRAKVYAIGFTIDVPEPLVNLTTLASKTSGVYRRISEEKANDIATEIEAIARELQNQYVITFEPLEWKGSEAPVNVRLEVTAPNGTPMQRIYTEPVKVGLLPTDHWNAWLKYVVFGLGGLLGIGLIWLLIKAVLKGRKNRPVEVAEEEGPVGPYKGKLTALTGVYAGKEFYLTEDVTTIGSIAGNSIVLQEQGVSKRHAGIKIEEMRFELADFGSTNGTHVNGAKITKQFLRDGDEIRIGECKMKFSLK